MNRRSFSKIALLSGATAYTLSGCASKEIKKRNKKVVLKNLFPLAQNAIEGEYSTKIEGKIPRDLRGVLYRNGPSLFQRGEKKRDSVLDGDGMVSRLEIGSKVSYRGKYVRTEKFIEEEKAGRLLYDTWATVLDKDDDVNIMNQKIVTQSSVSVKNINGQMYAFDESTKPSKIDNKTLETLELDGALDKIDFQNAHGKIDPDTGEFINFGLEYGANMKLHTYIIKDNKVTYKNEINISDIYRNFSNMMGLAPYSHDFLVSENFIIFNLQPVVVDIRKVGSIAKYFLNDEVSIAEAMTYMPSLKNKIIILSRNNEKAKPLILECNKSVAFWHTFNAYEENGKIICDLAGYDGFNFFDVHNNALPQIMKYGAVTKQGVENTPNGTLYRYVVDVQNYNHKDGSCKGAKLLKEEKVNEDNFTHEFCMINPKFASKKYKYGYATTANTKDMALFNGFSKFDFDKKKTQTFFFDRYHICGEVVFCPKKNNKTNEDNGYLLATVFNSKKQQTFIAILDASNIKKGPIAKIYLDKTLPFRLHGDWVGA